MGAIGVLPKHPGVGFSLSSRSSSPDPAYPSPCSTGSTSRPSACSERCSSPSQSASIPGPTAASASGPSRRKRCCAMPREHLRGVRIFRRARSLVICNEAFRRMHSLSQDTIFAGARFEDMLRAGVAKGQYPDAIGRELEWMAERLRTHRELSAPIEHQMPDGRWLLVSERRTSRGGSAGLRVDITTLKNVQAELRASREHLARAQRIGHMGSDARDLRSDAVEWSDETFRIFGVSRDKFVPTTENFLALVHPDDRPRILARLERMRGGNDARSGRIPDHPAGRRAALCPPGSRARLERRGRADRICRYGSGYHRASARAGSPTRARATAAPFAKARSARDPRRRRRARPQQLAGTDPRLGQAGARKIARGRSAARGSRHHRPGERARPRSRQADPRFQPQGSAGPPRDRPCRHRARCGSDAARRPIDDDRSGSGNRPGAGALRRCRTAPSSHRQPGDQCGAGDRNRRGSRHGRLAVGQWQHPTRGCRYRLRDGCGHRQADLRAVLYDEDRRRRHGARPVGGPRDRRGARRPYRGFERTRPGNDVHRALPGRCDRVRRRAEAMAA